MRRTLLLICLIVALVTVAAPPASARAAWKVKIDRLIGRKAMGVAVAEEGRSLYRHRASVLRTPASNQKLLLSMALLDRLGLEERLTTTAAIRSNALPLGTYHGRLWLIGRGDPTLAGNSTYGTKLPFEPTHLRDLAREVRAMGIERIEGRVMGGRDYFDHDWWAYGWKADFPDEEVALPTALTVNGNMASNGNHLANPEYRAAERFTVYLRRAGVEVTRSPSTGVPPIADLAPIATIESAPLRRIVSYMNRVSHNFFAETLGKLLGTARYGPLGTIDKGARAIRRWTSARGVELNAYDASGLSFANRVSTLGMVELLGIAEDQVWGAPFRAGLARGGQGTMEDRPLKGIRVRVKTGTLDGVSTLSGYVFLKDTGTWAEFSIMSRGLAKSRAVEIENQIVRTIANNAA